MEISVEEAKEVLMEKCDNVMIASHNRGEGLDLDVAMFPDHKKTFPVSVAVAVLKYAAETNDVSFAFAVSAFLYAIVFDGHQFDDVLHDRRFVDMIDAISAYLHSEYFNDERN